MGNLVRGTARVVEHADQNFLENTRIVGEAGATGHVAEAAESSLARTLEFRPAVGPEVSSSLEPEREWWAL